MGLKFKVSPQAQKVMIGFFFSFMIYSDFTCWNEKNGGIKNGKNVMEKKKRQTLNE